MQTAIVIRNGDQEILVRLRSVHVGLDLIAVDTRSAVEPVPVWRPTSAFDVRLEND